MCGESINCGSGPVAKEYESCWKSSHRGKYALARNQNGDFDNRYVYHDTSIKRQTHITIQAVKSVQYVLIEKYSIKCYSSHSCMSCCFLLVEQK